MLLPWWRRILVDRFAAVVMVRPPAEVAWSLWVRDGLPVPLGQALWAAYYRHLATTLEGLPVIVVDYPSLVERPSQVVVSVLEGLARVGVEVPQPQGPLADVVDPVLRRTSQPLTPAEATTGDAIQQVVDAWSMGPVAVLERFVMELPSPTAWEVGLLDVQRGRREAEASASAAREEQRFSSERANAADERADAAEAEVAVMAETAGQLRDHVVRFEDEVQELRRSLSQREARARAALRNSSMGLPRMLGVFGEAVRHVVLRIRILVGLTNPLFDVDWYRRTYPDVPRNRTRAWLHWRRHGWREGRDPDPLFDTSWYLSTYPDVRESGMDPLAHYLLKGAFEGRDPGSSSTRAPTWHGIRTCWSPGSSPCSTIGTSGPLRAGWSRHALTLSATRSSTETGTCGPYPDVGTIGMDPYPHYRRYGAKAGRDPSPFLDRGWYLLTNPDVAASVGPDRPLPTYGAREGRNPCPGFHSACYLAQPRRPFVRHQSTSALPTARYPRRTTTLRPAARISPRLDAVERYGELLDYALGARPSAATSSGLASSTGTTASSVPSISPRPWPRRATASSTSSRTSTLPTDAGRSRSSRTLILESSRSGSRSAHRSHRCTPASTTTRSDRRSASSANVRPSLR